MPRKNPAILPVLIYYVISCGVLNAYLDPGFRKVNFEGHFLSHEDVRVPRLGEQRLKDIQLRPGERRPLPTLFPGVTWTQPLVFRLTKFYCLGCQTVGSISSLK